MIIAIPGGHLTPALALIDHLATHHQDDQVVFFGRKFSQDILQQASQEADEIAKRSNAHFVPLAAPRQVRSIQDLLAFVTGTVRAAIQLRQHHVDKVLSFGGYQALPVCLAAKMLGLPLVIHEQTRVIGKATKITAPWARAVALSYPDTQQLFPAKIQAKVHLTGNVFRKQLLDKVSPPSWWNTTSKPVLFVTGGNQGSQAINQVIAQTLPELTKAWYVIHQTGNKTSEHDYLAELQEVQKTLPTTQQQSYYAQTWFSEQELAWLWPHTTVAIARAGANTVTEVALFGVPTIFIPLPSAYQDEQQKNIQPLVEANAAILLPQTELLPARLLDLVTTTAEQKKTLRHHLTQFYPDITAVEALYTLLLEA